MINKSINIRSGLVSQYEEINEKKKIDVNYNNYTFNFENINYQILYINSIGKLKLIVNATNHNVVRYLGIGKYHHKISTDLSIGIVFNSLEDLYILEITEDVK